jgi:hypothetical protein
MERKRRRGRPPKPPGEGKELYIQMRVDHHERDAYIRAADAAGLKLSAWMRAVLSRAAKRQKS